MYSTSSEYKTEIAKKSIVSTWYGTITLTDGTVLSFGKSNIDQNKSKLVRQYVNGETLEIGNAFSSELVLGLRDTASLTVSAHHYEFYGAVINITFRLYGDSLSGGYEDVPCGLYTVDDAKFTYHTVTLTAYDNLNKAAKTNISAKMSNATAYNAISSLCTTAGITLATTEQQITAMPNGTRTLSVSAFAKGTSVKEILEDICACLCANAVCNRSGNLEIKQYASTSVRTIGDNSRYSSSYVDYLGRYVNIALENADGAEEVYPTSITYTGGKELTLSIGKNVLLNKMTLANRTTAATAIIDALAPILYAPLDMSIPQDPSIDIGDAMTGNGSNFSSSFTFINTKDEIPLFGQTKITSAGGNYELANNKKATKVEKAISDLSSQTVELGNNMTLVQTEVSELAGMINVGYILPTGADGSDIADGGSRNVLIFDFTLDEASGATDQAVSFFAEICFYIDTTATETTFGDALLTVTYTMDGTTSSSSVYAYGDGWKVLTLNGFFPGLDAGGHTFTVAFSMSGGSITTPS